MQSPTDKTTSADATVAAKNTIMLYVVVMIYNDDSVGVVVAPIAFLSKVYDT